MLAVIALAIDCSSVVLPAGGRDDQAALALADGRRHVDEPTRQVVLAGLEAQPLGRRDRRELGELDPVLRLLRVDAVDRLDADHRVELLAALSVAGLADLAGDRVTAAQAVLADHRERQVDVVDAGQVAAGAHERVVVEHVEDAGGRHQDVVVEDDRVGLVTLTAGHPGAVAVASAPTPVAAATLAVEVAVEIAVEIGRAHV